MAMAETVNHLIVDIWWKTVRFYHEHDSLYNPDVAF